MSIYLFYIKKLTFIALLELTLVACNRGALPTTATQASPPPVGMTATSPAANATPLQPSTAPAALAARINGIEISLEDYQGELARYRSAIGVDLQPADKQRVLDDLINQTLLAQAAVEKGHIVDETTVQARIDELTSRLGSADALVKWMADNHYNEASFRIDLARSMGAAWMRDQIGDAVPQVAEQIHARQIMLYDIDEANQVLSDLQAGKDFATLAAQYDPITEGDLGWFPRGYLLDPEIDDNVFSLEPNQYSGVIRTRNDFHILQVIERDPQRPLSPEARLALQTQALQSWLQAQRNQSDIQVLLPAGD